MLVLDDTILPAWQRQEI